MISRRKIILGGVALLGLGGAASLLTARDAPMAGLSSRQKLKMPPLLDTTGSGRFALTAQAGMSELIPGKPTPTIGFNQPYLGPVIRMQRGAIKASVSNTLPRPVTSHWHGLLVPGQQDGGPHLEIAPGSSWQPELNITQPPCTAFFHTHIHGRTGPDVYAGLAGVIHVTDGRDEERGLPSQYGIDDLTLVLQDRRFGENGHLSYAGSMMDVMHGMTGDTMLINGQLEPVAPVPKAVVRLRLVNASNARIYSLFASDGRPLHLIATDGGYITSPLAMDRIILSPGERAEVLVDFQNGQPFALMSDGDPNQGMGGMIGRIRGTFDQMTGLREFVVIPFAPDSRLPAKINSIPDDLGGQLPGLLETSAIKTRHFSLDMGMGGGMMGGGGGMMGGMAGGFAINGQPYSMDVINEQVGLNTIEKWVVTTDMLAHPFHIHGVSFKVERENRQQPSPQNRGWKDTVLVDGETELLVQFNHPAAPENPFMYHCHILEHEDGGMMGQFTVG